MLDAESTQAIERLEGLRQLKKSNYLIGNQTATFGLVA
jgi:hypothetical protein